VIGKILRDLNDTFIQYLIERNGLEYWLEECSGWDPDCASPFDMAMIQWGWFSRVLPNQMGLGEGTAYEWNSTLFPFNNTEYALVGSTLPSLASLSIATQRKLLYGEKGIVEGPLYLLELLESVNNEEELEEVWGISQMQWVFFNLYILSLANTYDLRLYEEVTVLDHGGGLFTKRSVNEWVFDCKDPLLVYMQPRDPQVAIRYNDTSIEDSRSYKPGNTIMMTGSTDIRDVANVTQWNGTKFIEFWNNATIPVFGNNQDGQFFFQIPDGLGRFPEKLEDYDIWSPDHGQTIYLTDSGMKEYTKTGIEMWRYLLRNETYNVTELYFQSIEGFINGSFHMNPPFRKRVDFSAYVPLFFSQPRFWAIDTDFVKQVELLNVEPNLLDCATIIDIEPISGNALGAKKRLQVNFFLQSNGTNLKYFQFHPDIKENVMYPLLYISQDIFVTDALEEEWNDELGIVLEIRDVFFIVGLVVGSVGFVLYYRLQTYQLMSLCCTSIFLFFLSFFLDISIVE